MDKRYFSDKIVEWYLENKRDLPWRNTADPYKIWLSEIILQQTRVIQGLPYYKKFLIQFPSVASLAKAPEQEVLRLWQGLGYYTRARNLHKCAKKVSESYNGKFPARFIELKQLPGIGDYTAAAIASFAFKEPVAVVDGNVFRVLSRIYGIDTPINTPQGKNEFTSLAGELISNKTPDLHNQAIMEFGATYCTPKNPQCEGCIFQSACFAYRNSLQDVLPVKLKLKASRSRYFHYIVLKKGRSLLMKKRVDKDIWHGLFDFPLIEHKSPIDVKKILKGSQWVNALVRKKPLITISETYKHILSHQTIFCTFVIMPKPVLVSRFLTDHAFHS
jgi:A/G-specific adenine glycosylase